MSLPAAYTKGADALKRSKTKYVRKTVSFSVEEFDRVIRQVEKLAKADQDITPTEFYPPPRQHKGTSRDLPMVDQELRNSLIRVSVQKGI